MENQIEIYQTADNQTQVSVKFEDDTVWLNQKQMAELFGKDRTTITRHLNKIFKEGELEEKVVCAFFAHTTQHGAIKEKTQNKDVKCYNLDALYRNQPGRGVRYRETINHKYFKSKQVKENRWQF